MKYRLGDITVKHWNDWDNVPRMPQAVAAAVGNAILGSMAIQASLAVATAVGYIAIGLVTSWAMKAMTPSFDAGAASKGLLTNALSPVAPQQLVYGKVRKGGIVTYREATGNENEFLHQIITLAGHEVNSIGDVYINDEIYQVNSSGYVTDQRYDEATQAYVTDDKWGYNSSDSTSKILIEKFTGPDNQNIYTTLSALTDGPEWQNKGTDDDTNFKGEGIACVYIRLQYDQDVFADGLPVFTFMIEGKKVYDPRSSTTAYSANAALCIRDYLVSAYGLDNTGDVNDTAFSAAANTCDETVTLDAGGTEKRYEVNGVINLDRTPSDILADLMTACAGTLFWGQGEWHLKVGEYTSSVKTFTLDDLRSGINLNTKHSRRDNFNIVRGTFSDANQDYIMADYPEIRSATFIADDNNVESAIDLHLPFTTSHTCAQRLAKMTLFRAREQMTFTADFGMEAFQVECGDVVALSIDRYGWSAKEFEVVGWKFKNDGEAGDMRVSLTLRETSSAAFDWNAEEDEIKDNDSTLTNGRSGLNITNLVATGGGSTQGDGTFINSVILTWTAPSNKFVSYYEVDWKPTSDSNYASTTSPDNSIELSPLIDGVEYTIRVRAVTAAGARGPYSTVTFTGGGDTTAPALPTSISATGGFKYITINWTNPADSDLNFIEVYENTSNTSSGATLVGVSAGSSFTRTNLGLSQTRYYFLKSVDYSGNKSAFTSGVFAQTTYLDDADFENGVRQLFIDQGKDIIEPVSSLPVSGDYTNQQVFLTTTGTLYYWDGSSWQNTVAAAGSVDFSQLTGTIAAAQISGRVVAADNIVANSIDAGVLAASGVITSAAMIDNGVIENAKIANLAVERAKIGNNAANEVISFENTDYNVPTGSAAWNQFQDSFNTYDDSNTGAYFTESFTLDHEGNASTIADVIVVCSIHTAGVSTGDEILYRGLQIGGNSTSISSPYDEEEWRTTGKQILANATFIAAYSFSNIYDGTTLRAKMGATVKYMDANNSNQHGFNFKGFIWIRYR